MFVNSHLVTTAGATRKQKRTCGSVATWPITAQHRLRTGATMHSTSTTAELRGEHLVLLSTWRKLSAAAKNINLCSPHFADVGVAGDSVSFRSAPSS
jgi:hypothetical protein